MHAFACAASIGHGALRARQRIAPAASNKTAAIENVHALCFDKNTNHGAALTSPASVAPAPSVTSKAGNAQQSKVPADVNRLRVAKKLSLRIATSLDLRHIKARVCDERF